MNIKQTKLKKYFPMILAREEVMDIIRDSPKMSDEFSKWKAEQQEQFLDICTGNRGVKMLYDVFFKEILSPESTPERLSDLLSCLIGRKVTVKAQLPNDTTRIGDEMSLVITDIVVELEDGTIANVEVQKVGYLFLGERSSCYSADMLLRQYKRVRAIKNDQFSYNDMKPVYTIVFMEKSPEIFHKSPTQYIHKFWNKSDTGLELNLLQNYVFIPIDIFLARLHNKGIKSKLDAWLTFLGSDDVGYIDKLINKYPEFRPMYQQLYDMCCNVEGVMQMFSKELEIMDHNTVRLMIDEYQERLEKMRNNEDEMSIRLKHQAELLEDQNAKIEDQNAKIEDQNAKIEDQNATIEDQSATIEDQSATIEVQNATIEEQKRRIAELEAALAGK